MRIKAEGDYDAIKALVDQYGVHFDPALRDQVVARYKALDLPTYWAGVNTRLTATLDAAGNVTSVTDRAIRATRFASTSTTARCTMRRSDPVSLQEAGPPDEHTCRLARRHAPVSARARRRSRGRAAVCRRLRRAAARQKILIYHLYQAALAGRDIYYDQRYAHNLAMREVLEEIVTHADGIDAATLAEIQRYTKLFWINTGPYNNLTARKFVLKCHARGICGRGQTGRDQRRNVPPAERRDPR